MHELEKDSTNIHLPTLRIAIETLEALPIDKERCAVLHLTEQAWEEAQEQCIAALSALIAKVEHDG